LPVQRAAERCGWLRAMVDSGGGVPIPERRTATGGGGRYRSCAGQLAGRAAGASAGPSQRRRPGAVAAGHGCSARLQHGGDAGRRAAQRR
jgi:hypothetical protein